MDIARHSHQELEDRILAEMSGIHTEIAALRVDTRRGFELMGVLLSEQGDTLREILEHLGRGAVAPPVAGPPTRKGPPSTQAGTFQTIAPNGHHHNNRRVRQEGATYGIALFDQHAAKLASSAVRSTSPTTVATSLPTRRRSSNVGTFWARTTARPCPRHPLVERAR